MCQAFLCLYTSSNPHSPHPSRCSTGGDRAGQWQAEAQAWESEVLAVKTMSTVTGHFLVPRLGRGATWKRPRKEAGGGGKGPADGEEPSGNRALCVRGSCRLHKSIPPVITHSETQVPPWPVLFSLMSPPPPPQAKLMTHFALGLQQQHPAGCPNS